MGLKDLAQKTESKGEIPQENAEDMSEKDIEMIKQSVAVDSAIQGSFYFISGCVHTFMRLKGYDEIAPDELFKRLKEIKGLTKQELEGSEDPLHEFLLFYFHDKR